MVGPPSSQSLFDFAIQFAKRISPAGFSPEITLKYFIKVYMTVYLSIKFLINVIAVN